VPAVQDQDKTMPGKFGNLRFYLRQRPVMLGLLSAAAVSFFLIVTGLSSAYRMQREALGDRWFNRGVADLHAKRYDAAVTEFRAALLYSRDNYVYQLNLAEALIGAVQTGQAYAYLLNLWDREPEDGLVNLDLARIAASKGQTQEAIRYYHDAVYAIWPSNEESQRREARLELIDLLLRMNAKAQAQAELIALSETVGEDSEEQQKLADLFMRADGYERALGAYLAALKADRHNTAAMAGAGNAAFQLGRYTLAEHYLQAAVAGNVRDSASVDRLKTTEMVLHLDPYRPDISKTERNRLVMDAFAAAGQRLTSCALPKHVAPSGESEPTLSDEWTAMKPRITLARLERDPDLADSAMDLVFRIEKQASTLCGTPAGTDLALLLISRLHEGS
jgi:hypothetical protein